MNNIEMSRLMPLSYKPDPDSFFEPMQPARSIIKIKRRRPSIRRKCYHEFFEFATPNQDHRAAVVKVQKSAIPSKNLVDPCEAMIHHRVPVGIELEKLTVEFILDPNSVQHNNNKLKAKGILGALVGYRKEMLNGNQLRTYEKVYGVIGRFITKLFDFNQEHPNGYKQVNSRKLKKEYKDYWKILRFLLSKKIIQTDGSYHAGDAVSKGYCKGYRLNKNFRNDEEPQKVPSILKQVEKEIANIEKEEPEAALPPKDEIYRKTYNMINNDISVVIHDWRTLNITESKLLKIKRALNRIEKGKIRCSVSALVKRFFHEIAGMPKEGRIFLRYKDQGFTQIDISCSHLFQIITLHEPFSNELQKIIDDDLYRAISTNLGD